MVSKAQFRAKSEKAWTKEQLDLDTRINAEQLEFLLFVEQYYLLYESLPTYEVVRNTTAIDITEVQWEQYWAYAPIREALLTRGVRLTTGKATPESGDSLPITVSGRQLELINALVNPDDTRPDHKKKSDAGITEEEYQHWLADPVYWDYYQKRAHKLLEKGAADADRALLDNVRMGDQRAIAYYNEMTGRYRPQDPQVVNFTLMVNQIIDILAATLPPDKADHIGGLILAAIQSGGVHMSHPAVNSGKALPAPAPPVGF